MAIEFTKRQRFIAEVSEWVLIAIIVCVSYMVKLNLIASVVIGALLLVLYKLTMANIDYMIYNQLRNQDKEM